MIPNDVPYPMFAELVWAFYPTALIEAATDIPVAEDAPRLITTEEVTR